MKLLTFRLRDGLFGIKIESVKEINRHVGYTQTPTADTALLGLYNMRGQIVTIFDLAHLLGYEQVEPEAQVNCIILKPRQNFTDMMGFAVDTAVDVVTVDHNFIKAVPPNVPSRIANHLIGVYQTEQDLLLMVNEEKLFFQQNNREV